MVSRRARVLAGLVLIAVAAPAGAQSGGRPPLPSFRLIDSIAVAGDTAQALTLLAARIAANRRDAEAWHRQGMLTWQRSRRRHGRTIWMNRQEISDLQMADSSLRWAIHHDPANARYRLDLGRFLLTANLATTRFAAYGEIEGAVKAAREGGDPKVLADALDAWAMLEWRRYETFANRYALIGVETPQINPDEMTPSDIRTYLEAFTAKLVEFPGEAHYHGAIDRFNEAVRADPDHVSARRHLYMALAERGQWEELRAAARRRLDRAPWDASAWLALGLAEQRSGEFAAASAAFDSTLALSSDAERDRLTRLTRLLRPADTTRYLAMTPERRAFTERMYWVLADPLWMTDGNEYRSEFLARIAFAELRWTSDDFQMPGAETDRGQIHIRYGPPDWIHSFSGGNGGMNTSVWTYANGLTFVFREPPTWGTAYFEDPTTAERFVRMQPLAWDNVDALRRIDSIPARVSRFRAPADSADVLILARIPTDSLMTGVELDRTSLYVQMRILDDGFKVVAADSTHAVVRPEDAVAHSQRGWRRRIGPGMFLYRIEAAERASGHAARAVGRSHIGDSTFVSTGFGISDVVIAERAEPRAGEDASRWSEFAIVPLGATVRAGTAFALLWETYELAAAAGTSRFRVEVTLRKVRQRGLLAMAGRIIAGIGTATGLSSRGEGEIRFRYERSVAARPVVVDYFSVDLGTAPPGDYVVRVAVTDLVANRSAEREVGLRVAR